MTVVVSMCLAAVVVVVTVKVVLRLLVPYADVLSGTTQALVVGGAALWW